MHLQNKFNDLLEFWYLCHQPTQKRCYIQISNNNSLDIEEEVDTLHARWLSKKPPPPFYDLLFSYFCLI
jgi:hypothetical protein